MHTKTHTLIVAGCLLVPAMTIHAQDNTATSDEQGEVPPARERVSDRDHGPSLMAQAFGAQMDRDVVESDDPHALRAVSMFSIAPEKPRAFHKHDLVQIVVFETSTAKSTQELSTDKSYSIDGGVDAWPHMQLKDLLQLQAYAGRTDNLPRVAVSMDKGFDGDGEYERKDDMSARLTAEVIEILPNGNLVVEARTSIKTDQEEAVMKVTGICRPTDVTPANTILSNQLHDLKIEKMHKGELKKSAQKGVIAQVLDALFAF